MTAAVDTGEIVQLVGAATLAGVAVAVCFALVILGATRASDLRRAERSVAAGAYAALSALAGVACLASVAFGVSVIVAK